jgi:hypothetical protein
MCLCLKSLTALPQPTRPRPNRRPLERFFKCANYSCEANSSLESESARFR